MANCCCADRWPWCGCAGRGAIGGGCGCAAIAGMDALCRWAMGGGPRLLNVLLLLLSALSNKPRMSLVDIGGRCAAGGGGAGAMPPLAPTVGRGAAGGAAAGAACASSTGADAVGASMLPAKGSTGGTAPLLLRECSAAEAKGSAAADAPMLLPRECPGASPANKSAPPALLPREWAAPFSCGAGCRLLNGSKAALVAAGCAALSATGALLLLANAQSSAESVRPGTAAEAAGGAGAGGAPSLNGSHTPAAAAGAAAATAAGGAAAGVGSGSSKLSRSKLGGG